MKTRIAIILISAVALVSFTAVSSNKASKNQPKSYQSGGGQTMVDKNQFN